MPRTGEGLSCSSSTEACITKARSTQSFHSLLSNSKRERAIICAGDTDRPMFPDQATDGAAPAVQWTATGFGEQSQGLLRQVLGSVASSGKAAAGTVPDDLKA